MVAAVELAGDAQGLLADLVHEPMGGGAAHHRLALVQVVQIFLQFHRNDPFFGKSAAFSIAKIGEKDKPCRAEARGAAGAEKNLPKSSR